MEDIEVRPPTLLLRWWWDGGGQVAPELWSPQVVSISPPPLPVQDTAWSTRYSIVRFRMVKIWIPQNTFFSWFFTGRAFIMVYYIIKLVLAFQFDLQNPLKQPIMWIFEKWKIIVFGQNYDIFWPKGGLKPCIIMYLGNIHNMFLDTVTFGNFLHFLGRKAIFHKVHFIQKWSVTPNKIFGCVKNDFLLYNPKLVFFTEFNPDMSNKQ